MKRKKGVSAPTTSAGAISTLIALIALFMVIYILLLPPTERRELLDLKQPSSEVSEGGTTGGNVKSALGETILSVSPGRVSLDIEEENEHEIAPVRLFSKVEADISDISDTLTLSRGGFSNKFQELSFSVDDINTLETVTLYFFVSKADGNLILDLNGREIFNSEVGEGKIKTITLPLHLLSNVNVITFSVSSPGILFFTKNSYILTDVQINKRFKVTNIRTERSITLNAFERENLDKASLDFFVFCETLSNSEGRLRIFINDQPLYSDVVLCDRGSIHIDISPSKLKQGENLLDFSIDKGDYTIEQIILTTEVEGGSLLKYQFFVEEEEFTNIFNGKLEAELSLLFGDEGNKNARLDVNGDVIRINTEELDFTKDISGLVKQGNNFIKIIPTNEFVIDLMEVKLV